MHLFDREAKKRRLVAKRIKVYALIERLKIRRGCEVCQRSKNVKLELDHFIPRYLGGRPKKRLLIGRRPSYWHALWYFYHPNIQVLCGGCHKHKTRVEDPSP